ncbi:hypothetical protein N781_07675 [Pontibacillus halophilus JSM 076056 = DSM 19796]|uniref:DUF86 domain-containing protein n=1 Tax=Pontibacillus halophilus JSM 076056 = DSM 19796 TaxID=1385510 RepID=A0A0A5GEJ1_9BACI|nr:DUF86 domain-containing protein [Pontibacillus halophilus]KGX89633.1 hypothetical protein N781_07675 [Pontibacillus halophilus JSM 076056 = DSM 19796]
MYFVNREAIEQTLTYLDGVLSQYEEGMAHTQHGKLALERLVHVSIESIIDVGNMMIDGFIMRDPGSYSDIIDILVDEKVLPEEEQTPYQTYIKLRKELVQSYTTIDHDQLLNELMNHSNMLNQFSTRIRSYLDNELGPVSAFTNS